MTEKLGSGPYDEKRPDWVHCIMKDKETWCGEPLAGWQFVSVDHAALSGINGDRLVACPQCVHKIIEGLRNGHDE